MSKFKKEDVQLAQEVDYIIDSLGRFVFTREYHLKRGYCCENGCLNCPYPINPLQDKVTKTPSGK